MRTATVLYSLAVVAMPISVACKFLLGAGDTNTLWVDPTLVLALAALLVLLPHWGDFLTGDLQLILSASAVLFFLSLLCAISGMLIRPPASLYDVLREPLRLWLNLSFFLLSAWFLVYRRRVVLGSSIVAITFGLASGIYFHLVAFGLAPASEAVVTYTRAYLLRQTLWFNGIPVPRMGGLFFESPPFGLFMLAMLVVLIYTRKAGGHPRWANFGVTLAVLGTLFSLADQVLVAGAVGLFSSLPQLGKKRAGLMWPLAILVMFLIFTFELQSIVGKNDSSVTGIVTRVSGSSVGERAFHIHYGLSLLQADAKASFLGIGPGRYGEYAGETGMFLNTVNIQTSEIELLVEWGVCGMAVLVALLWCVSTRAWQLNGLLGIGLLLSLILADSFQANWKHEAVFLALAALCTRPSEDAIPSRENHSV